MEDAVFQPRDSQDAVVIEEQAWRTTRTGAIIGPGLEIGRSIHISAVNLPEGVTPVIKNRDFTIATIAGALKGDDETTTAATTDAAAAAPADAKGAAPAAGGKAAAPAAKAAAPAAAETPAVEEAPAEAGGEEQ